MYILSHRECFHYCVFYNLWEPISFKRAFCSIKTGIVIRWVCVVLVCLFRECRNLSETDIVHLQHSHGDQPAGSGLHGSLLQKQVSPNHPWKLKWHCFNIIIVHQSVLQLAINSLKMLFFLLVLWSILMCWDVEWIGGFLLNVSQNHHN